jgi:ElaB/YqjD/DUF883 family membrane-anchored ribosome-binding protein
MENEERAQLEAHYQNEIESIKGEVARLTNLLEQVLSSKNRKGIFAQPPVKDLVHAFLKQYKFNLEITPDRTILMAMEKENQESVRAYAQRWRDKATYVQPPLIDTEMVMLFAKTFQSPYYEHLIGSLAQHFHEVVRIAERIEQAMKRGKIEGSTMDSKTMMRDYSGGG